VQARLKDPALSVVLFSPSHDTANGRVSVRDLLTALGDWSIGAPMFVFAMPNVVMRRSHSHPDFATLVRRIVSRLIKRALLRQALT
jgi:hypothetical protein